MADDVNAVLCGDSDSAGSVSVSFTDSCYIVWILSTAQLSTGHLSHVTSFKFCRHWPSALPEGCLPLSAELFRFYGSTNVEPQSGRPRRFRTDSEVRCEGAHSLYHLYHRRGSDPIKLTYNACRPNGRLKLTARSLSDLKAVCQQSWWTGTLLRITCRFFPGGGRNHR